MIGAITGDIVGSCYEFHNIKTKKFKLFDRCWFTDDSVMSIAVAKAILEGGYIGKGAVKWMRKLGRKYPDAGYGGRFYDWIFDDTKGPYNSWGNGSAMRISPVGFASKSMEEVKSLSKAVTEVTHNHPEGLKGAEATAASIFLLRNGMSREELRAFINDNYYKLDFTIDGIRESYKFDVSCQGTVPQAIVAFLESTSFEDAIRNAISIGGDSDTLAAITGGIAESFYGVPEAIRKKAMAKLTPELRDIVVEFEDGFQK